MDSSDQIASRIVERAVGPVFHSFYTRLNRRLAAEPEGTVALYMTRAGIRLLELHKVFNDATGVSPKAALKLFNVSRLAAVKSCMRDHPESSAGVLLAEYRDGRKLTDVLQGLGLDTALLSSSKRDEPATPSSFLALCEQEDGPGPALRDLFARQADDLARYLDELLGGCRNPLVVDSGWYGTTQMLLMQQFPDLQWHGCYYGKWRYRKSRPAHFDAMSGLCVDEDVHPPHSARRLSLANYHLVESLLEPDSSSVVGYRQSATGAVEADFDPAFVARGGAENPLYLALRQYLASPPDQKEALGYRRLARSALFPSREEVQCIVQGGRSADMGKRESNPLVLWPGEYPDLGTLSRYRRSIWKAGQLTCEFPRPLALAVQCLYTLKFMKSMSG